MTDLAALERRRAASDCCPCGAPLTLDPINRLGFTAHCQAGHRVWLPDLDSPGVILDDVESRRL